MPRKSSLKKGEFFNAANILTDMLQPVAQKRQAVFGRVMSDLSMLCGNKAKESGGKIYDIEDVLEAFPKMQEDFRKANITTYGVSALLNGNPPRIEKYLEIEPAPPVWDSMAYDKWVLKNARQLKRQGFRYPGWSCPEDGEEGGSRLRYELVQSLELV